MRGNVAVVAGVIIVVLLAILAYYYISKPAATVPPELPQLSEEEINALGQYEPIDLNMPMDENMDLPAVSADDMDLQLPETI